MTDTDIGTLEQEIRQVRARLARVEGERDSLLDALEAFTSARLTLPRGEGSWSIAALYEAEKLALATIASTKGGA